MDLAEWEACFSGIRRSTLTQDYDYARAVCPLYGQKARWGLILIDGKRAGLVQMLEAKFLWIHGLSIDRGPLWFPGFGGVAHIRAVMDCLNREFPKRFGRKRRLIPELPASPTVNAMIGQSGWTFLGPDYTTAWLDLTPELDVLRNNLRKNWRAGVQKAEASPLEITWDDPLAALDQFIVEYTLDRTLKNYGGPSAKLLRALGQRFAEKEKLMIGRARLDNQVVAAILILVHGSSATYQAGWSNPAGRTHAAHQGLLWSALGRLKQKGVIDFDVGGIHDASANGVSDFKDGLGGQRVTLSGLYT